MRITFMHPSFRHPLLALFLGLLAAEMPSLAQQNGPAHYHDEVGQRFLTVTPLGGPRVEIRVRWASEPGSTSAWLGQGDRRENQFVFAAVVEEGQDRGTFFITKGGESKLEILFRPGQRMPQDPGILGAYRRISEDKQLQLAKKEFQAAEDRLAATLKAASRAWSVVDRPAVADWKARWPGLQERWMKIAWQPQPASPPTKPAPLLSAPKAAPSYEKDSTWWMKRAESTALAYGFVQQPPDAASKGAWEGDYDDGFGGRVSIRRAQDGRLRVNLSCTRVSELQGSDIAGSIPAEAVMQKNGESLAEAVFQEPEVPEAAREVQITLRRKGGFLWVETRRKMAPPGSLSWFDGIYRWMPPPQE